MGMNVPHQVFGGSTSTSGTGAQTILSGSAKIYKNPVLVNPSGSGAGIWSADNFVTSFPFAAGPSATHMCDVSSFPGGVQIKRSGGTDVSGAFVVGF